MGKSSCWGAISTKTEWQFICTRGRPHPIKEYIIIYIKEGLLPQPWLKLTMVARNRESVHSLLLGAPFP